MRRRVRCHRWLGLALSSGLLGALPVPPIELRVAGHAFSRPATRNRQSETRTPPRESDRPVVHAARLSGLVVIDGHPDEPAWRDVPVFSSFVQQVPHPRAPATERTEVQVGFDDEALYVAVRAHQSPDVPIIANELRRDAGRMHERNDTFTLSLDTFHDRRNGYVFYFNALGAENDWACWDEGRVWSQDWNTVWEVRTAPMPDGWSAEMRLPFSSLRFKSPGAQQWGVNFRRIVLARNEWTYATFIPPEWGTSGIGKFSSSADLVGVVVRRRSLNLEVDPYALAGGVETACRPSDCRPQGRGDVGVDAKYGLSSNLTADMTYNTDFSQVEADEQQINFTRFSLFFPEKRQFFLEGKGIFDFGVTSGDYRLLPFFSRRIGLEAGHEVPILGGARLTGKAGPYAVGVLGIRTVEEGAVPASTFAVARLRRDILERSGIGVIAVRRDTGGVPNDALGADAYFAFSRAAKVESFIARAWSPGREAGSWAGRLRAVNDGDLNAAEIEYLRVGPNFDPQAGYVRRRDMDRWFARLQRSPRPAHGPVRKVYAGASLDYVRDTAGRLESRAVQALFKLEFHSADLVQLTATRILDAPTAPFVVAQQIVVPAGSYSFTQVQASWDAAPSRRVSGRVQYLTGGYYGGTRRELTLSGILKADRHLYADVNYQLARLVLPAGSAFTHLAGVRLNHSTSTTVFTSALVQWNSASRQFDVNARFNWIYRPMSNVYLVYSRTTTDGRFGQTLRDQSLVLKVTRLMRF
jgi:hypothetical protein